jgi:hypothetical protein
MRAQPRLGTAPVTVVAELERDADPAEVGPEAGAPDDVTHAEDAAVLEHGQAAQRLAAGTYGLSIESGKPIPDERLRRGRPTPDRGAAHHVAGSVLVASLDDKCV